MRGGGINKLPEIIKSDRTRRGQVKNGKCLSVIRGTARATIVMKNMEGICYLVRIQALPV